MLYIIGNNYIVFIHFLFSSDLRINENMFGKYLAGLTYHCNFLFYSPVHHKP